MTPEPFSANALKIVRTVELRRVLGILAKDHSFGSSQSNPISLISCEELKQFRGSNEETCFRNQACWQYSLQNEGDNFLPTSQGTMADKDKSILIDKDKSMLKACDGDPMPVDYKACGPPPLPVGGDGKMKRKRSLGTMVNRPPSGGDQELKQRMLLHRHSNKPSPRSGNGLGFRLNICQDAQLGSQSSSTKESGANGNKSKEQGTDIGEGEDKKLNVAHKVSAYVFPIMKNKVPPMKEIGYGVPRQSRTRRGSIQSNAFLQIPRPPLKKPSNHKGSTRPLQNKDSGFSELAGETGDLAELLAVAKAVQIDSWLKNSGPFWKEMEPIFSLVGSDNVALLKEQINFAEELDGSSSGLLHADYNMKAGDTNQAAPSHIFQQINQTNLVEADKFKGTTCSVDEPQPVKAAHGKLKTEGWFEQPISLSHRLLSAVISEEENEKINNNSKQGDAILQYSCDCSPYSTNICVQNEHSTTFRSSSNIISGDELLQEDGHLVHPEDPNNRDISEYEQMSLNDRILMELHSIDIYPDSVPNQADGADNDIDKVISELKIRLYQQVGKKKIQLLKLERVIQEQKDWEMRNREKLAMDKLVERAYNMLLGVRGSRHNSKKRGGSKVSKQLAIAFAERTLARCHKYEETGQSCFSEPMLRDILFSVPVHGNHAKCADGQLASQVSAFGMSSNMIKRHGPVRKVNIGQFDSYQGHTQFSEPYFVRDLG